MQIHRAYDGAYWVYGTAFERDDTDSSLWWYLNENEEWSVVDTPQGSIGELDINGKETFLNDIIKHHLGIGVIRYANCEYYVAWRDGVLDKCTIGLLDNTYEVIGNLTEENL